MLNNVSSGLIFDERSDFYIKNDYAINQYNQTKNHPAVRIKETVQKNFRAQEDVILGKILAKNPDSSYTHFDVILDNFFYLTELSKKGKNKDLKTQISTIRKLISTKQKGLFTAIARNPMRAPDLIHNYSATFLKFPALSAQGSNVKKYDSAMHVAARVNNLAAMRLLQTKGCPVDSYKPFFGIEERGKVAEGENETPLAIAFLNDNIPIAQFLFENGAKLGRFGIGCTPTPESNTREGLNFAAYIRSTPMAQLATRFLKQQIQGKPELLAEFLRPDVQGMILHDTMTELIMEEREKTGSLEREVKDLKRQLDETNEKMTALWTAINRLTNQDGSPQDSVAAEPAMKRIRSDTGNDEE